MRILVNEVIILVEIRMVGGCLLFDFLINILIRSFCDQKYFAEISDGKTMYMICQEFVLNSVFEKIY